MTMQNKRSEALGIALNMEREGIRFYTEASARMTHPLGKKMFLSLVGDEQRHERIFRELAAKEDVVPAALASMPREGPIRRVRAIFKEVAREVKHNLKTSDDEVKVLEIAKGMEAKTYDFYVTTAKEVADPKEKDIFNRIAEEENEHWRILDDTLLYLTNQAEWNLKEERPLIDGG